MHDAKKYAADILLGIATGDALGVPVEFITREVLAQNPVTGMIGFGTHQQPSGTWSDDSSLSFCLAEMLCCGYNLEDLATRFVMWYEQAYWTAHDEVFDVGIATSGAIWRLKNGATPVSAGGADEQSNGNGSLMRILPLALYIQHMPVAERFRIVQEVSSLTHAHIRSVMACFIYLEMALCIMAGLDKMAAYRQMVVTVNDFIREHPVCSNEERDRFHRILLHPIGDYEIKPFYEYDRAEIQSDGYVLSTLEASLWCLFHTGSYADATLMAVNLGKDTDTTAAVTGGLAGLLYGHEAIPAEWLSVLSRRADIEELAIRLYDKLNRNAL